MNVPGIRWCAGLMLLVCASSSSAQFIGKDAVPAEVETAYVKGLKSLVATQKADGSWDDQYGAEPAVVGLAVMAMLAHGDDPEIGPYKEAIRRGIRYIIGKADAKTGQIGLPNTWTLYSHGFATLALAEAYGMVDDPLIGSTLQRAVDFLVAAQKRNPLGAWRYTAESTDADSTLVGSQMVALLAARNAGLNVPDVVIANGLNYLKACQAGNGSVKYEAGSDGGGLTTTAIGMLVFKLARQKDTPFYRAAAGFFKSSRTQMGQTLFYHEYYAAQAAFHCDETTWQAWNVFNIQRMTQMQDSGGGWKGQTGGAFSTAGALLSLALNYRYLPIYER